MSKRREEEKRILAELDEAVAAEREERRTPRLFCKRCKNEMDGNICPVCGYKIYTPMAEEKRKKIRTALTVVLLGIFVLLFFVIVK